MYTKSLKNYTGFTQELCEGCNMSELCVSRMREHGQAWLSPAGISCKRCGKHEIVMEK